MLISDLNFPEFWNVPVVLKVLQNYDSYDLPGYFLCSPAAFTKLMKIVMPDKPSNLSYKNYLSTLEIPDPKLELQDKFMKIYKQGAPFNVKLLAALSEDEQRKYAQFRISMDEQKN